MWKIYIENLQLFQVPKTRKFTRARNVVFNEKRVVGFTNETREDENNDLLFDVTFDDEIEQSKAESVPKTEVKDEGPEVEVKVETPLMNKTHQVANLKTMLTLLP